MWLGGLHIRSYIVGQMISTSPVAPVALSPDRLAADLAALAAEPLDVLVIGGGIVGAGTALDAVTRGLRVGVVEAQDWASGTSSRSSKLIHGGLRYLQMHDFSLVREALHERSVLLQISPHLVHPVPFIYPLRHRFFERAYVGLGILLYDLLARTTRTGAGMPFHRQLSRRRAHELAPALRERRFIGAVQYYDGQVDDARHTLSVLRTAASHGAFVASRLQAVALLRERDRVTGARLRLVETGQELEVRARVVVSATGVWTEDFEGIADIERDLKMKIQPSKGVHLVVPRRCIDSSTALILPTEKSVLFALPWGEHWLVGTTDTNWAHDRARPTATAVDVDYLLATLNEALESPLSRADVESVYVGLRPLIAGAGDETTKLSREHAVNCPLPGLVLVSGGKYTTYRVMARDAVDAAVEHARLSAAPCRTERTPIVGADGFAEAWESRLTLAAHHGLPVVEIERLLRRYGSLVGEFFAAAACNPLALVPLAGASSYLQAEVAYAVTHEGARHLDDVLERRTRLAIETRDRGTVAAEEVAAIMAPLLGWTEAIVTDDVEAYRATVGAEVAAEQEPNDALADAHMNKVVPFLPTP